MQPVNGAKGPEEKDELGVVVMGDQTLQKTGRTYADGLDSCCAPQVSFAVGVVHDIAHLMTGALAG
jgi:hypothetical protein